MATLGEQAVGSIVKLNVGGVATNFIVAHHGNPDSTLYDASCDGTWLIAQEIYELRQAHSSNASNYSTSNINTYLNNDFFNLLDSGVQNAIKTVQIPYVAHKTGTGTYVANTPVKVFLPAYQELGATPTDTSDKIVGAVLAYFNGKTAAELVRYYNGKKQAYFTRSKYGSTSYYNAITTTGKANTGYKMHPTDSLGICPTMILLPETAVSEDGMVGAESGAITGTVLIDGVQRELTGKGYINIGGVLRDISDSQVNIGGTLRSAKG